MVLLKYSAAVIYILIAAETARAFSPALQVKVKVAAPHKPHYRNCQLQLMAKKEEEDDERSGMKDAFASLDGLSAMDFADDNDQKLSRPSSSDTTEIKMDEGEIKKYKEMYEQMENDDGRDVYNDILGDMGSGSSSPSPSASSPSTSKSSSSSSSSSSSAGKGFGKNKERTNVMNDADGIGSLGDKDEDQLIASDISPQDTDEFMAKALKEAMEEVKKQNDASGIDPKSLEDSILNDEEIMKEINAVFDKANDRLLEGIKEIREEQAALTKASSERRTKALEEEEQRLREAEGSVSKLVEKVKQETLEVEKATRELEALSSQLGQDPLMKAADLKQGGIVKQSALVGAVLFSLRSVGDIAMMGGPDGASHGAAALVQGVIALACAAYLLFF